MMNRNNFLKTVFAGILTTKIEVLKANDFTFFAEPFKLPALAFNYNALEPHIDALTMEIHHSRHHQTYITNLNKAIVGTPAENLSITEIITNISKYSPTIKNNGGGHWNHTFFWEILSPSGGQPSDKLRNMIVRDFESFEKFQSDFTAAATARFGSGWAWLIVQNGKLKISSTPNQENPLMDIADIKGTPILALDVWEHAYYLKYQNKRADYIKAFWKVVNWDAVEKNLNKAL